MHVALSGLIGNGPTADCVPHSFASFQVLISGAQVPISLEDLKSFTNYSGMLSLSARHVLWDGPSGRMMRWAQPTCVYGNGFFCPEVSPGS